MATEEITRTEERLAAWVALLQAHATVVEACEASLQAERGLQLTWFEVLLRLSINGGRMRLADVSRSLFFSKSGVTRLVDRMEAAGLVAREPSPDDRRVTWAVITDAGREAFESAMPVHLRTIEEHFTSQITDEESRVLRTALGKVLTAAGKGKIACSPADFEPVARSSRAFRGEHP